MRKPDVTLSLACAVTGVLNCEAVAGKLKHNILNPGIECIMLISHCYAGRSSTCNSLTFVSLPPLATKGSELHIPRANSASSVCPTNSKSGVLAVLSCLHMSPSIKQKFGAINHLQPRSGQLMMALSCHCQQSAIAADQKVLPAKIAESRCV